MYSSRGWLPFLLPGAVAALLHANTIPGDFVYDDVVLIEKGDELRDFDLHRIFLGNYWGPDRADRNYRPLVLLTYALNYRVGAGPAGFHAVNVLLDAAVAVLAALLLHGLLKDRVLAALGGCLFAALPIHVEAVANIVGRAELLAGAAVLGAWLIALRDARWSAVSAAAVVFCGLLSKESAIVAVPLMAAGALILRRRLPWRAIAGSIVAVAAYLAIRAMVLGDRKNVITFGDNPLVDADAVTRILNAVRLLGLYAWKTVAPLALSADYSFNQIPVLPPSSPALWASALGIVLVPCAIAWAVRRRAPLAALAVVVFPIAFCVTANVLFPIGTIFGERLAYLPSFAFPLLVCAVLQLPALARARAPGVAIACVLVAAHGARTWVRNADWSDRSRLYLRMPQDAPDSMQSYIKAAEAHVQLWRDSRDPGEKQKQLAGALEAARHAKQIYSESGKADAKIAEVLFHAGQYRQAAEVMTAAILALDEHHQIEVAHFRIRGECYLRINKYAEALEDFERCMKILGYTGARPDPVIMNFRGLALGLLGRYPEALADLDRSLSLRQDLPEVWNNRGMCKLSMHDFEGAISDWQRALSIARADGPPVDSSGESARSLLLKIADAYRKLAAQRRESGDSAGAAEAETQAAAHAAEAARLR